MIRNHNILIKRKRGEDKYDQEGGPIFNITTAVAMTEVCVVDGKRARERSGLEDKGKREKRQAASNRAKKK